MGQTMSAAVGYIILFCLRLQEKAKELFQGNGKKDSKYYNHNILLKDDEQRADILSSEEINRIIKQQQTMKKHSPNDINLNEYKMIKNSSDMEEAETLTISTKGEGNNESDISKEIKDLQKEVIDLHVDDGDKEAENGEEVDNIEDLKASIMDHD